MDPKATGEAIDEMLAANDPPTQKKRKYPEPDFPIERSGAVGGKWSSREMGTPKEKWSSCECRSLGLPVEV